VNNPFAKPSAVRFLLFSKENETKMTIDRSIVETITE